MPPAPWLTTKFVSLKIIFMAPMPISQNKVNVVETTQLIVANNCRNHVFDLESLEAVRGVHNVHFGKIFQPKLLVMMSSMTYFMH